MDNAIDDDLVEYRTSTHLSPIPEFVCRSLIASWSFWFPLGQHLLGQLQEEHVHVWTGECTRLSPPWEDIKQWPNWPLHKMSSTWTPSPLQPFVLALQRPRNDDGDDCDCDDVDHDLDFRDLPLLLEIALAANQDPHALRSSISCRTRKWKIFPAELESGKT